MKPEIQILEIVSEHLGVSIDEMKGRTRAKAFVAARQVFFYLCYSLLPLTYKAIAEVLNMDHSSAVYSIRMVEEKMTIYAFEREAVNRLMTKAKERLKLVDVVDEGEIYMENDYYKNK